MKQLLTLLILLATFPLAQAKTQALIASVDRDKLYENDTFTLKLQASSEMGSGVGGMFNFGRSQMDAPDISPLEEDFEILDQRQSTNIRSINGKTTSVATFSYTLAPKRSGRMSVPSLSLGDAHSEPVLIQVLSGKAPKNSANPPDAYLEVEVDKPSAFVQEQVVYKLRLFSQHHIAGGNISEPELTDAIVESAGDAKESQRMAYNRRYSVHEWTFYIFPQSSGTLTIDPQSFTGTLIDSRTRRRIRAREVSDSISIDVKAPPSTFSGNTWLPATSLELRDNWDRSVNNLVTGDSLTRTVEIEALGLLGSALPPMTEFESDGLKIYPEPAQTESFQHTSGVRSKRSETQAMVAIKPASITLPEIKIPWWDTVNNIERIAVLPAKTINIEPGADWQEPAQTIQVPVTSASAAPEVSTPEPEIVYREIKTNTQPFWIAIVLLLLGWVSSIIWLLKRNQTVSRSQTVVLSKPSDKTKYLIKAIKENSSDMPKLLVDWAREHYQAPTIRSLSDLKSLHPSLGKLAMEFEASLYSGQRSNTYEAQKLIALIKELEKKPKQPAQQLALRPMYP